MTRSWLVCSAGIAAAALAPHVAWAQVPPAMDRAPAAASMVVGIANVNEFISSVTATARTMGVPGEGLANLDQIRGLLATPGVNGAGSAAIVLSGDGEAEDPPAVLIAPVSDFGAMVTALGGEAGAGVREVEVEGKPLYAKDLTGGFAAISDNEGAIKAFEGTPGAKPAFEKLMGKTGAAVAEGSSAFLVANIEVMGPQIRQGLEGMKMQMQMMAAMSGANADLTAFDKVVDDVLRDGSAAVLGLRRTDAGLKFDAALQFREGTEFANSFSAPGKSAALAGAIPNQPFILAAAIDTSSPLVRRAFKAMAEAQGKQGGEAAEAMAGLNPMKAVEKMDGIAFFLGNPPSLTNGLLLNTATFIKTTDPQGYIASVKDAMTQLNGKTLEGVTYQTSFEEGGAKVGEKAVDVWSMRMKAAPDNPMGMQIAQFQSVLFGAGAMSGYVAPVPGGVVATYGKNSALMGQVAAAAANGKGLASDPKVQAVTNNLPADRTAEAYIGAKTIMETVTAFMGMFDFQLPEDMPPVGLAVTTTGGGARLTVFTPTPVLEAVAKLTRTMQGDEDEEIEPDSPSGTGQPRF